MSLLIGPLTGINLLELGSRFYPIPHNGGIQRSNSVDLKPAFSVSDLSGRFRTPGPGSAAPAAAGRRHHRGPARMPVGTGRCSTAPSRAAAPSSHPLAVCLSDAPPPVVHPATRAGTGGPPHYAGTKAGEPRAGAGLARGTRIRSVRRMYDKGRRIRHTRRECSWT